MKQSTSISGALDTLRRRLSVVFSFDSRFELVAGMTLVLLLLKMDNFWYLQMGLVAICSAAIFHRPLVYKENFWLGILVFLIVTFYHQWYALDNHKYLIAFWCLALACACMSPDRDKTLALSARWLIGLCFAFAAGWKLITPEYTSGSFFHHLLLTDARFDDVAEWLGGVSRDGLIENRQSMSAWIEYGDPNSSLSLTSGPRIPALAGLLTWWTVAIETIIALSFLWSRLTNLRDICLLFFIVSTYTIAPVIGFAWLLAIMGMAQCQWNRSKTWPALYLAAFWIVEIVSHIPVREILGRLYHLF